MSRELLGTLRSGLVARTIIVDVSMPHLQQSGPSSRNICKVPCDTSLKNMAEEIKKIPGTQVWLCELVDQGRPFRLEQRWGRTDAQSERQLRRCLTSCPD
jgi:hypothetical protein